LPARDEAKRNSKLKETNAVQQVAFVCNITEKNTEKLKKKTVVITAAALGMALLFFAQGAGAANPASDNGSLYQNPWGPANPQFRTSTGFASWVFDQWNPPTQSPAKTPFFIDTKRGAWGVNVPADIMGQQGYDAAWISFTGDGYLHNGQSFSTTVLFTAPGPYYGGPYGTVATPTEGIDFFAQDSTVPSNYDSFGHQVLGIYLGPTSSGLAFTLVVHTTLSDENPAVVKHLPIPGGYNLTAGNPLRVNIKFTQESQGQWRIQLTIGGSPIGAFPILLVSNQFGATWNQGPTQGIDAVRYFTS
jgi:hypothetical protein